MNQEQKNVIEQVATLSQAIAYLHEHHKPDFKAFSAIINCHVFEVSELTELRQKYQTRNWYGLSAKMRSAISHRLDHLVTAASDSGTSREDLRKLADRIRLLRLLAAVATEYSQTEEALGN